jgi:hypothetical protein
MERHVRAFVCTCVCVFVCTCVCVCVCVRVRAQLSMRSTSEFVLTSVTVGGTFANHKCTSSSTYRAPYLCQSHQHMPKPLTYFLPVPTAYKKTQTHTHKSTHIDTHTHTHKLLPRHFKHRTKSSPGRLDRVDAPLPPLSCEPPASPASAQCGSVSLSAGRRVASHMHYTHNTQK